MILVTKIAGYNLIEMNWKGFTIKNIHGIIAKTPYCDLFFVNVRYSCRKWKMFESVKETSKINLNLSF